MKNEQLKKLTLFDCDKLYPLDSIHNIDQNLINSFGPWDYQLKFAEGVWAKPDSKNSNRPEEHHLPYLAKHLFGGNLKGMTVLDLGCNIGHFSFKASELGAKEVVGVEFRKLNLVKASFARSVKNAGNVKFYQGMIEDVSKKELGMFDIVILAGIFFHLTQPVQVLNNIYNMTRNGVLIDTNIVPSISKRPIIEVHNDTPEKNNWGVLKINFQPSVPALEKMVRAVGFQEMLELRVKNHPYLTHGLWLNNRKPDKLRRQVFYAFKNSVTDPSVKKTFCSPWYGTLKG